MLRPFYLRQAIQFVRCTNAQQVPESMCLGCGHTLVACSDNALDEAETRHRCSSAREGGSERRQPVWAFLDNLVAS